MDFTLLALPLPLIWTLNRSWREKFALSGIFILGGLYVFLLWPLELEKIPLTRSYSVCFASIYRIVVLFYINPADTTCKLTTSELGNPFPS